MRHFGGLVASRLQKIPLTPLAGEVAPKGSEGEPSRAKLSINHITRYAPPSVAPRQLPRKRGERIALSLSPYIWFARPDDDTRYLLILRYKNFAGHSVLNAHTDLMYRVARAAHEMMIIWQILTLCD